MRWTFVAASVLGLPPGVAACRDLSGFTTGGGSFEGAVVSADFVRTGVGATTRLCLTLDADHLQDAPGALSTNDGRFRAVAMRTIPQIWQDPLSTLTFGEGRVKNLLYIVGASQPFADGNGDDVLAVVSLMQSGNVEVRLLRGAPPPEGGAADSAAPPPPGGNLFAVFALSRQSAPCSY
jgi:hypothetical protein